MASAHLRSIRSGTTTVASVASSLSDQVLLAANTQRLSFIIHNKSNSNLYIKIGSVATIALASFLLEPGAVYFADDTTDVIHGIWETRADGSGKVTEKTP